MIPLSIRDAGLALVLGAALLTGPAAFAQSSAPATNSGTRSAVPVPGTAGNGTLSKQLSQSNGVITPQQNVDPAMPTPAPSAGTGSTPVIPPPGTPGGNPAIQPK